MTTQVSVETLSTITYKQIPVITTELLAHLYGTEAIRIRQNHHENKGRFIEEKHFFKLEGETLREFKHRVAFNYSVKIARNVRSLILWTERGQPVTQKCSKPIGRGRYSKNWKTAISAREKQHQPNSSRRFSHNSQPKKSSSFATCSSGWKKPRTSANTCIPL
nr:ORF6N domain-containing protein [Escherichia coli]